MSLKIKAFGQSHLGMKRNENQDAFMLVPEFGLFVVADGMGGHRGGQVASLMAVTEIVDFFRDAITQNSAAQRNPGVLLQKAISSANMAIQRRGSEDPALQGMGTTTTAIWFTENQLFVGHVGDSRCYLVHPDRIWQLTRDHSLVQEKLRAGLITREQLKTDSNKNVITRSVGFEPEVEIDVYRMEPQQGDVFLICSDGLSGMLTDTRIREIISQNVFKNGSPESAVQQLIKEANQEGGDDNVTAVVAIVL